jgi:MoxR-like ATPase
MGIPCHVIQCGKGLTEYTLLGEQTIDGGDVVWKDGILPRLFREVTAGLPCVVMLDEGDHLSLAIQSILHAVLEGRVLDLPNGEKVEIPKEVVIIMTSNTYGTGDITGRHSSAQQSDEAFLSRWVHAFEVEYLDPAIERDLLLSHGIPGDKIDGLMQFVQGTRDSARKIDKGEIMDGIRTPTTLRALIPLAQSVANGTDFVPAFCGTVMACFTPDEQAKARELVRATLDF